MRSFFLIFIISILLLSCGQSSTKETDSTKKETSLTKSEDKVQEQDLVITSFSGIPKSFEDQPNTCLIKSKSDLGLKYLFVGQSPFVKSGGIGVIQIGNEQVEVQLIKQYKEGLITIAEYASTKFKVTYTLDYSKNKGESEGAVVSGTLTVEGNGYKKQTISVFGFWGT